MKVVVIPEIKPALMYLSSTARKQIPFATARALTWTAKEAAKDCGIKAERYLDRPTPFTKRGFGSSSARKNNLQAYVFIKDIQAKYMKYQVRGGTRLPTRRAIGVPTDNQRVNKYGNMTRGKIKSLLANPKNFSGTVKGVGGIWRRTGGKRNPGVKLLVAWEPKASYRKRYPFRRIVQNSARANYARNFQRSFALAMRSAR